MGERIMNFDYKRWWYGKNEEERKKLIKLSQEFGELIDRNKSLNLDREAFLFVGTFSLLEYVHYKRDNFLEEMFIFLETFFAFLSARTKMNLKDLPELPTTEINYSSINNELFINGHKVPNSDGTIECLDLIKAINLFINSLLFNKGESNWITQVDENIKH